MKKTYEKPKIEAVTYAANTSLCGSCANILTQSVVDEIIDVFGTIGLMEEKDLESFADNWNNRSYNFFAESEGCSPALVDFGYCKFTAGDTKYYLS